MAIQYLSYGLLFTTVLIALFGLQPSDAFCWPKVKYVDSQELNDDCALKLPKALEFKDLFKEKKSKDFDEKAVKFFKKDENIKFLDTLLKLEDLKEDFEDKKAIIKSLFEKKEEKHLDKFEDIKDKIDYDLKDKHDYHEDKSYSKVDSYEQPKSHHYENVPVKPYNEKLLVKQVEYLPEEVTYVQKEIPYKPKEILYAPKVEPYVQKPIAYKPQHVPYVSQDLPYIQTEVNYGANNNQYGQNDHAFYTALLQQNIEGYTSSNPTKLCECSNYHVQKPPCCFDVFHV